MARVICDMSMSVDGYVTGPNDSRENPFGDGAEMLHDWIFDAATDEDRAVLQEMLDSVACQRRPALLIARCRCATRGSAVDEADVARARRGGLGGQRPACPAVARRCMSAADQRVLRDRHRDVLPRARSATSTQRTPARPLSSPSRPTKSSPDAFQRELCV
jgi:hypothetical protein